jgi:hypothetical protein
VNLEGVKRIMQLESELASAREELAATQNDTRTYVEAAHRQYRRDLVPVRNTIALFIDAQRRQRGGV